MVLKQNFDTKLHKFEWDSIYAARQVWFASGDPRRKLYYYDEENYLNMYFSTRMICRAKKIPNKRNYKILSPLPDNFHTSMSFGDCAAESAEIIVSKVDNRTLNLMWSGGIDSTVVFWALIGTGHPFHIHFDNTAKVEHPELWERIHNNEFKQITRCNTEEGAGIIPRTHDPNHVFVMGEPGDNIHGAGRCFLFDKEERNKPYQYNAPEWVVKHLEPSVNFVLNDPNCNLKQWHWAWSFMCKYQYCSIRSVKNFNLCPYPRFDRAPNMMLFYDTPNFNRWSITNQTENSSWQELREYKMPAKDYILACGDSQHYRDNKLKVPSSNRARLNMFDKDMPGFEPTQDYMLVIKRTFGGSAPDIMYDGENVSSKDVKGLP